MSNSETVDRRTNPHYAAWRIAWHCNFRCSYCSSGRDPSPHSEGSVRLDLYDALDDIISRLRAISDNWTIAFTGGEPLLYPRFDDICGRLAEHFMVYLDTNLSRPIDDWIARVPPERVEHVYAAFHLAERIRKKNIDQFLANVMALKRGGYTFTVNYVMYPPVIGHFQDLYRRFESLGVYLQPKAFKGMFDGKRYPRAYTKKQRELLLKYAPGETKAEQVPNYLGRTCNAGHTLVRILEDGTVTRCVTDVRKLGNVYTGFSLYDEPATCIVKRCPCYGPKLLFRGITESFDLLLPQANCVGPEASYTDPLT